MATKTFARNGHSFHEITLPRRICIGDPSFGRLVEVKDDETQRMMDLEYMQNEYGKTHQVWQETI